MANPPPTLDPYKECPTTKNVRFKLTSAEPFVPQYVQSVTAATANVDPKALYEGRVKDRKIMLENPFRASRKRQEREERKKKRQEERERKALGVMSGKEARKAKVWRMRKEHTK